jgi:hypothetical protein
LTRILSWLGASILVVGCRYVVSFDEFTSGGEPGPAAGNGGSSGGAGGLGGSTGGESGTKGGGGGPDKDASPDGPPDTTPTGAILVYTAPSGTTLRGIDVHGSDLYWVECCGGRGVFKMPGGGSGIALPIQNTPNAFDVAVDTNSIYWSEGRPSFLVLQIPITGGVQTMPTPYFPHNSESPSYIAVDDAAMVYVTTGASISGDASINGDILSGKPGSSFRPYPTQPGVAGIAFYGAADAGVHDLYWGFKAGIRFGPTQGDGMGRDIWTGGTNESVQGVATDGQNLFWITDSKAIKRTDITVVSPGATNCINPPQDLGPNADIAANGQWIYFTWPNRNSIYRCLR